jgi:hypothetical protein
MRAREFVVEDQTASNQQVWRYIQTVHPPEESTPFLKNLVLKWPLYELRDVPLSQLEIPPAYYPDDEEEEKRVDPYGRTLWIDYDYAGEVSTHNIDRMPIVVDPQGHIIDGNHRAWAARELMDRNTIKAWVAVPEVTENFADGKIKGKSRPGRVKRAGASCQGSVTDLRARAKKYGGERGRMHHWCANMKSGRKKSK